MRRRKGANTYSVSYMIGGFIVTLTIILITTVIAQGGFLTQTDRQGDRAEVQDIAGAMKNKCDDATTGSGSTTSIGLDASFDEVDEISITGSSRSYNLEVLLNGGNTYEYTMEGCRYELEKKDQDPWDGGWHFDISHEENTQNPAVVKAVASKR